jgi:hypothetical protein
VRLISRSNHYHIRQVFVVAALLCSRYYATNCDVSKQSEDWLKLNTQSWNSVRIRDTLQTRVFLKEIFERSFLSYSADFKSLL